MHSSWNPWPHTGRSRPVSRSLNSKRHTAHSGARGAFPVASGAAGRDVHEHREQQRRHRHGADKDAARRRGRRRRGGRGRGRGRFPHRGGGGGVLVVEPDEAACERGRGGGRRRWPPSGTTRRCRTYSLKPCAGEGAAGAGAIIMPSMRSVALIERACSAQQEVKRSKTASSRANLLLLLSETE